MPLLVTALALLLGPPAMASDDQGCAPRFRDGELIGCACVLDNVDYERCQGGDEESCETIEHCLADRLLEASPVFQAALRDDRDALLPLILPMWTNERARDAEISLLLAVLSRQPELLAFLLEAGANPSATALTGQTALELAMAQGRDRARLTELLLDAGADPNRGRVPPLVSAAYRRDGEAVALLLAGGADPNLPSGHERNTALIAAASKGNLQLTRALLEAGADPAQRNMTGQTALWFAKDKGHEEVARLLEEAQATPRR
jgi:ankyrin repeat protein